jgi:hypothetical protein
MEHRCGHVLFREDLAYVIQQILVGRHSGEDFASWPHARFGIYLVRSKDLVRSAYNLARTKSFFSSRSAKTWGKF